MARKLKNISVEFISLVKKGANNKTVILKSADSRTPDFEKELVFKNVDGILYGVVYSPDETDLQGDFADAAEIKKAAYSFMKGLGAQNVDAHHDGNKRPAFVAESWILKKGDPVFPDEKEGAWAVGIQLEDAGLIAAVQKGEITGLSMAGYAEHEEVSKAGGENTILKMFRDMLDRFDVKKNHQKEEGFTELAKGLTDAVLKAGESIDELKAENEKLKARIAELEDKAGASTQETGVKKEAECSGIV